MPRNSKKRFAKRDRVEFTKRDEGEMDSVMRNIFFPSEGALTPISDEIAKRFIDQGMKPEDIEYMRSNGYLYCPERDSFVGPAEIS